MVSLVCSIAPILIGSLENQSFLRFFRAAESRFMGPSCLGRSPHTQPLVIARPTRAAAAQVNAAGRAPAKRVRVLWNNFILFWVKAVASVFSLAMLASFFGALYYFGKS